MVTSVDDNIKYLKNYGAKHHIEMSIEIMYYTQGLQFRRREDGYLQQWITRIKDQPLKWMMSYLPSKEIPILTRLGDFIWRQPILTAKTSTKHSMAGQLEWMMLCNEASDIRTRTSESFLRNGSQRFSTDCLVGRTAQRWRGGERRKTVRWTSVLRAHVDGVRYLVGDFQGNR